MFLTKLAQCGNVSLACKAARIGRTTAYRHREEEPEFRALWEDAVTEAGDVLEQEAWRRAVKGVEKPVYQGGHLVGEITEYSDTLLIFLLKGNKPEKFRDRASVEMTGKGGGPLELALTDALNHVYGDGSPAE